MIYYIADIHFSDERILKLCSKPFASINEYNETIIRKWNKKINDNDIVYIIGDIGFGSYHNLCALINRLKGIKHFIIGNHDLEYIDRFKSDNIFNSINDILYINDNNRKVQLCHYPLLDWNNRENGGYLIYGHIHNKTSKHEKIFETIKDYYKNQNAFNCGVDVCNYEPVTLDEMIKLKEQNKNETYIN